VAVTLVVHGELLCATAAPGRGSVRHQAAQGQGGLVEDVSQRNIRYNNLILHGSDNNKQQQSAVTVVIPPAEQPPGCHHLPILGGVRHPTRCVAGYWDVAQAQQHAV